MVHRKLEVGGSVTCFRPAIKSEEQPRTTPNIKLLPQGGLLGVPLKRFAKLCGGTRVLVQKITDTTERSALQKNTYKVTSHREQ